MQPLRGEKHRSVRRVPSSESWRAATSIQAPDVQPETTLSARSRRRTASPLLAPAASMAGTTASIIVRPWSGSRPRRCHPRVNVEVRRQLGDVPQGSAFRPTSYEIRRSFVFPANHAVLLFDETPPIEESAAFFESVGGFDPSLLREHERPHAVRAGLPFAAVGRPRASSSPATLRPPPVGVEYTPISPAADLDEGGAAFPATTGG